MSKNRQLCAKRNRALGRGLVDILEQSRPARPIFITTRASSLPPVRGQLSFDQVRECGPRSGISVRHAGWLNWRWRVSDFDLEITPALGDFLQRVL